MPVDEGYILRSYNAAITVTTPSDYVAIRREATLASGEVDVTVSDVFRNGSTLEYVILKQATVASGKITAAAEVAGDTDTVTVLIIGSVFDLIQDGG